MKKANILFSLIFSTILVTVNRFACGEEIVKLSIKSISFGSHVYGGYSSGIWFELWIVFLICLGVTHLIDKIDRYYNEKWENNWKI